MSKAQISMWEEKIVDSFAGGGGGSTGIELATGRVVDIAINHDPDAILMHKTNHPHTVHYQASVWDVDPLEVTGGSPVGLLWASPDCKHFSKAKGGKPKDKFIRGLAWVACRWAGLVRPRVIMLENVEEFKTWGPLNRGHHPIKSKQGKTFEKFVQQLMDLGYEVQYRELIAADYGAPTMRKRFFLIARCDGNPIVWPKPTHGPADSAKVKAGLLKPYVGAYTQLDFSLPCPSIFDTSEEIKKKYGIRAVRPLARKTMDRIARGVKKFVLDNPDPFVIEDESEDIKMPILIQYHSETTKDEVRGQGIEAPIMTVDSSNRYGLVTSFISKFYKSGTGQDMREPLHTITAGDGHFGEVRAVLTKYYGSGTGQDIKEPLDALLDDDLLRGINTEELPAEFYTGLNGDILIEDRHPLHPADRNGDLYIMGEYRNDPSTGRCIVLYYGSFRRVFRHLDEDELRTEMRRVLRHEFRHHVEGRAGVRDLEEWDADQIRAYRARKDAE